MKRPIDKFWEALQTAWDDREWISLSVADPNRDAEIRKWKIRPVEIGGGIQLQWTAFDARKRQTHKNRSWGDSWAKLQKLLGTGYRSAHLRTGRSELQIRWLPSGKVRLKEIPRDSPATDIPAAQPSRHNVAKQYLFPEGEPCPFLIATGIMQPSGQIRAAKYRKFRQINRFAEFVRDLQDELPTERPVRVVDYGCGKSYLTFAVEHLLTHRLERSVEILGLDANPEVIATCQQMRDQLQLTNVDFAVTDIATAELVPPVDLAIWLHACDTATDDALAKSIAAEARTILAVPCCQHELQPQLADATWAPVLSHGLLRDRAASLVTDALRVELLTVAGYRVQVLEFIDLEHTAKNVLLRAVRRNLSPSLREAAWLRYQRLKTALQIEHFRLEDQLADVVAWPA